MRRHAWYSIIAVCVPIILALVMAQFVLPADFPWLERQVLLASFGLGGLLIAEHWLNSGDQAENVFQRLGFRFPNRTGLTAAMLVSFPMWLFLPLITQHRGNFTLAENWIVILMGVFLVNGLTEEALHRGVVFRHFRSASRFWPAAAISSGVFAAQHVYLLFVVGMLPGLSSVLLAWLLGFPLALLFEKGGRSILPPAIAHTSANAPYLVFGDPKDGMLLMTHMGVVLTSVWISFLLLWRHRCQPETN